MGNCGFCLKLVRPLRNFRKGVAGFAGGGCTFGNVADGLKESATTKSVRPIENHACSGGTCYHVLRYAAQRRTLNPSGTLPMDLRSAAGRRILKQRPFRRENRFKSLPGNAPKPIILRSAAGRRTLNPPGTLPMDLRSAAGRRILKQNNAVLRVWSFYLGQGFRSAGPHLKIMKQKMMTCSMKLFCMGQRNAPSPHHPMG